MNTSLAQIRRHTDSVHKNTLFQIKNYLKCNMVISSYSILKTKISNYSNTDCVKIDSKTSIYYWLIDTWNANKITTKNSWKYEIHHFPSRKRLSIVARYYSRLLTDSHFGCKTHWGYITPLKSPFILKTRSLNLPQKLAEKRNMKTLDT